MKRLPMFALALLLAALLAVLCGQGAASATELCKVNESPCPAGNMYPAGTEIHAQLEAGSTTLITAAFATVECSEATFAGKTNNTGGAAETVQIPIETWRIGTCNNNCTVTVLANGVLELHTTGAAANGNAAPTLKSSRFTVSCFGVSCNFGAAAGGTTIGVVNGGNPAKLTEVAGVPFVSGDASIFVCTLGAGFANWEGGYEFTKPKPLFSQ